MPDCFIALGSNLDDPGKHLNEAAHRLSRHPAITLGKSSSQFLTAPVGSSAGNPFLNAAVQIHTDLEPLALLEVTQEIESDLGRTRKQHWGPRTIDLDIIFYGDQTVDHPRLQIPHEACWYRRFVLDPLVEIASDVIHPSRHCTVEEMHCRIRQIPLLVALAGGNASTQRNIINALPSSFNGLEMKQWETMPDELKSEQSIVAWLGRSPEAITAESRIEDLPRSIRLDVSQVGDDVVSFLHDVIHSAIG